MQTLTRTVNIPLNTKRYPPVASYEGIELNDSLFPYDLFSGTGIILSILTFFNTKLLEMRRPHCEGIKNGSVCSIEPNNRKNFTNLDFKKLHTSSVQSISVQLRKETEKLVLFAGTRKIVLTLKFERFD